MIILNCNKVFCWQKMATTAFLCFLMFSSGGNVSGEQEQPGEVLIGNELSDIAMDEDFVWIGTDKGVNRYDRSNAEWKFFTISDGLINNKVNCIEPERVEGILTTKTGDEVWFGTDSGVSVYNKLTGIWTSYTTKDGLIHNKVNAISARGDDVWIGTDKGASVFDRKKNEWMSYSSFPNIPTSKVTAVYHQSSYAWIGTQNGLARYNYKYKKWEYFTNRAGSVWLSPEGGTRTADDSPVPDDRINAIDGQAKYIYIATKSMLVEYDTHSNINYQRERSAYSQLGRARRTARNAQYAQGHRTSRAMLQMAKDRSIAWEGMGWRHIGVSEFMGKKKFDVSDNFLDVKYRSGEAWVATSSGLIRFDSWVGERQMFNKDRGLIDNEVNTIATIGSEVWAGTAHGLSTYNVYSRTWKSYRMERALPSSYVTTLAEDKDSMWFGTRGAVSSFDYRNERWKTFTRDEGLAGNNMSGIAVVGNFVWIGTDEGISRLNKSTSEWENFNSSKTGLVSDDVTCVLVDGKYIWIGTKAGLNRYDNTTGAWDTYSTSSGLLDNRIEDVAADPKYVWVGTHGGLNRYDKADGKWTGYTTDNGLSNNVISSLDLDSERVWAATRRGLNMMDRETQQWQTCTEQPVDAMTAEGSDRVWMGGRGYISFYEVSTGKVRSFTDVEASGLSRVSVYSAEDTPWYVWFATSGGIFRYNKSDGTWWIYTPTKQRGITGTLVDGNVHTMTGDRDFIYFGTAAGISRYDKVTGNWLSYTVEDGLVGRDVRALLLDELDVWVGTQDGISRYDTVSDTWTDYTRKDGLPSNKVYSLIRENGKIWAGTQSGAAFLNDGESKWQKVTMVDGLPDNHVWCIALDGPHIWFGTNNGAARYDRDENTWVTYRTDDGLMHNSVFSIGFEGKYVFLNTAAGTTIYDKELGVFTPFSVMDGLADQTATSIGFRLPPFDTPAAQIAGNGPLQQEVWIGTHSGATLYDLVPDMAESVTDEDGLASNKVQTIGLDGKYVWFGTDSGVSRYDSVLDEWITFGKAAMSKSDERSAGLISYNIKSLAVDETYVWVGTRAGLCRYDKVGGVWTNVKLGAPGGDGTVKDFITRLTTRKDKDGQSLSVQNLPAQAFNAVRSPIRSMDITGNFLWLGLDEGLYVYDRAMDEVVASLSEIANIRSIEFYDGKLWVVSDDLLSRFERGGSFTSWTTISDHTIKEEVISDGGFYSETEEDAKSGAGLANLISAATDGDMVWLGRERGLRVYNAKYREPYTSIELPDSVADKKVTAIIRDVQHIWVGTRNGLYRYNRDDKTWEFLTEKDGLASNHISCLAIDDKYVWVGTSDRGISRYDRSSSQWETFATQDGLVDNNVRAIAVDGKYVWFGTFSGGVCRYDKTSQLWTTYRAENYTGNPQT